MAKSRVAHAGDVSANSLWLFFAASFAMAWGLLLLLLAFPESLESVFGPLRASHPLFILAVYSPAIAAFALVAWHGGIRGLRGFLSRLLKWRAAPGWYALLLAGLPAVFFLGAAISGRTASEALEQLSPASLLAGAAFMLFLGPIEEFGWRGYATPLLQRRMAPVFAGLLIGLIWAIWHLPAFFLSGLPQDGWDVMPFMLGTIAASVILTALFNAAGGSILIAILFHWQINMPFWPDGQPWDMYLFVVLAVMIVWMNRDAMFSREAAATVVIPSAQGGDR